MKELAALSDKTLTVFRNDFLKVQGSIDTNLYVVESGSLRIFVLDGCEERTIRFGYAGDVLVALDSFLTGNPSGLLIQAL